MAEPRRRKSKIINNRSGKSKQLRKYEIAYNRCIKLGLKSRKCKKSIKKLKPIAKKSLIKSVKKIKKYLTKSRKRTLNSYQKFVRKESVKSIYKGRNIKSRMKEISRLWRKKKE